MRKALFFAGMLVSMAAAGHPLSPEAACNEPLRPSRSDVEKWNRFVADVDTYRACISTFVDAEYSASDAHRTAAERAAERWNHFVRNNLNVPEDFPHIPRRDQHQTP